jgi:hypothetical protein
MCKGKNKENERPTPELRRLRVGEIASLYTNFASKGWLKIARIASRFERIVRLTAYR